MTTLILHQSDDLIYTAAVLDENGDAYDLTGATLWFTAKRRRFDADADALAKLYWVSGGSSAGISVDDATTGEAVIRLTPSQTEDFVQAAHYWDLQLADTAGVVRTVDSGVLVVQPGVTARTTTP